MRFTNGYKLSALVVAVLLAIASAPALAAAPPVETTAQTATAEHATQSTSVDNTSVAVGDVTIRVDTGIMTVDRGHVRVTARQATIDAPNRDITLTNARVGIGGEPGVAQQIAANIQQGSVSERDLSILLQNADRIAINAFVDRAEVTGADERTHDDVTFSWSLADVVGEPEREPAATDTDQTFQVTNLDAPEQVAPGDSYTVTAEVENPADAPGTEIVRYRVDGYDMGEQVVQLQPGESTTVSFDVNADQLPFSDGSGTHGVYAFDSQQEAELTVSGNNSDSGNDDQNYIAGTVA